ncbi:hypothetical protein D1AOALGA4SA_7431 [Olavius algarvensis Delta 1 endosymbiont]|nr:hypothetical protein D1AOALGA4SA_7431 [Olavius algarvensis Delta 1 endosymbiont]
MNGLEMSLNRLDDLEPGGPYPGLVGKRLSALEACLNILKPICHPAKRGLSAQEAHHNHHIFFKILLGRIFDERVSL